MSSLKMVYSTNLVTMLTFVLEKPGKCRSEKRTKQLRKSSILLSVDY